MAHPQRDCGRYCQVSAHFERVAIETNLTYSRLARYDVVIYIDDSGSRAFEEQGERIKDLELIMQRVAFAATLFDEDGYGSPSFTTER